MIASNHLANADSIGARLPPLLLEAQHVAHTVAQGVHGRRRVGQGDSFWQYRPYGSEDSASLIDWRQSARTDRYYVRQKEWEAAQTVWLWRDSSASMNYASHPSLPTKHDRATILTLALASLLVRGGERIGLLAENMNSGSGRHMLERIAHHLSRHSVEDNALSLAASFPPRHAHLLLASDFLAPADDTDAIISRYSALGIKGCLLVVLDPAELDFPFEGRIRLTGMSDNKTKLDVRRAEDMKIAYQERIKAHLDHLRTLASAAAWPLIIHRTDHTPSLCLLALHSALSHHHEGS